ncbi:MAG: hypothetical protein A2Z30_03370 [Chloroflexi bacterium RBG_16_64_43]|nr:MAG: hypothetical protein A2Z30_03370 [Chloroflexi bacterium RBG_16_64_43]
MAGMDVEPNPTSSDFGKVRVGNTRYDLFGGFAQYVRLGAQLIAGPPSGTRLDALARFAEGKAGPLVSFATGLLRGTDFAGKPFNVPQQFAQRFIPIVIQDAWEAMQEFGPRGAALALPATFGVGVQTYE